MYGGELEPLVKSGLWASLSSSAHSLLVALMANRNEHAASTLSYDELRAASGLASTETISNATAELEAIHLLTVKQGIREIDLKRTKNIYRLNFDSEKYFAKISEAHRQLYRDQEQDKLLADDRRKSRRRTGRPRGRPRKRFAVFHDHFPDQS